MYKNALTRKGLSRSVLEFFCVLLYINYLSNLHEMFQPASIYYTDAEYQT